MDSHRKDFDVSKIFKKNVSHVLVISFLAVGVLLVSSAYLWTGGLHISALNQSLNDQTGYITTARNIAEKGRYESTVYYPAKMPYKSHNLPYMPGNYYIRAAFFYLFGYSPFISFLPNLLAFVGSAVLLFLIAKDYFDIKTAYLATILFMLFPPYVLYAFSAMMENLFVFACLLSFYVFMKLPEKLRFIFGGMVLILPLLIRETAAFMAVGFAVMIFSGYGRRLARSFLFVAISAISLFFVYTLPQVADRPPALYARLTNSSDLYFYNAFLLKGIHFTNLDIVRLTWLHFHDNIIIFWRMLVSWPWQPGFAYLMIVLVLFLTATLAAFAEKSTPKPFMLFTIATFCSTCGAMFVLYDYYSYTGIRILLFLVPFLLCIIVSAFLSRARFVNIKAKVVIGVLVINMFFFWDSLITVHNNFSQADEYDKACSEFLDSIGTSGVRFFAAPFDISLSYVAEHYPIRWSFIPANEETLRLVDDKYSVDMLVLPLGDRLINTGETGKVRKTILEDTFTLTGTRTFLNQIYFIYKRN